MTVCTILHNSLRYSLVLLVWFLIWKTSHQLTSSGCSSVVKFSSWSTLRHRDTHTSTWRERSTLRHIQRLGLMSGGEHHFFSRRLKFSLQYSFVWVSAGFLLWGTNVYIENVYYKYAKKTSMYKQITQLLSNECICITHDIWNYKRMYMYKQCIFLTNLIHNSHTVLKAQANKCKECVMEC